MTCRGCLFCLLSVHTVGRLGTGKSMKMDKDCWNAAANRSYVSQTPGLNSSQLAEWLDSTHVCSTDINSTMLYSLLRRNHIGLVRFSKTFHAADDGIGYCWKKCTVHLVNIQSTHTKWCRINWDRSSNWSSNSRIWSLSGTRGRPESNARGKGWSSEGEWILDDCW